MSDVHRRAMNAFRAHWRDHDGAYPQKLILTRSQAEDLYDCHLYGIVSLPGATARPKNQFLGRAIEISAETPGVVVAHDGTELPLADFDTLPPPK